VSKPSGGIALKGTSKSARPIRAWTVELERLLLAVEVVLDPFVGLTEPPPITDQPTESAGSNEQATVSPMPNIVLSLFVGVEHEVCETYRCLDWSG
jgi:hypothetical protein